MASETVDLPAPGEPEIATTRGCVARINSTTGPTQNRYADVQASAGMFGRGNGGTPPGCAARATHDSVRSAFIRSGLAAIRGRSFLHDRLHTRGRGCRVQPPDSRLLASISRSSAASDSP